MESMSTKKTFEISVDWTVTATVEIEAESLEEAIKLAHDAELPYPGEYVDDSFRVDEETTRELND